MKRVYWICSIVSLIVSLTFFSGSITTQGQVAKGSVSGSVEDPQGGGIPGVTVKIVSRDTNQEFSSSTDNAGLFRLSLLPPGVYRVEISKAGFLKLTLTNVEVAVEVDRGLGTIKLEIGE